MESPIIANGPVGNNHPLYINREVCPLGLVKLLFLIILRMRHKPFIIIFIFIAIIIRCCNVVSAFLWWRRIQYFVKYDKSNEDYD